MPLSNMAVYNEQIQTNTIEIFAQNVNAFNEATRGAIMLSSDLIEGDFSQEAFWSNLSAARRRVNRYGANGAVAATELAQDELVGVKIAGGFGPVLLEPSQLTWLERSPAEAVEAISQAFANELLRDQLNTAIGAAVAAIENQPSATSDVSATAGFTQVAINKSHAKFGDASQRLVCTVMHGSAYHKLIEKALNNGEELYRADDVLVVDILGKRVVVTDADALFVSGTPNKFKALSLATSAIMVEGGSDIVSNLETTNGKERIETTWQSDYSFLVKLKGYAWDTVTGGKSPDDAAVFTGTNWDVAYADIKNTAGVLCIADADL